MSLANAILQGDVELARRYLQAGAPIGELDEFGYTPLIESAIANDTHMAEALLAHKPKPDVNQQDLTGGTALHWAAENANLEMMTLLLENSANPNLYTTASEPPLVKPFLREQRQAVKLLRKHGASVEFAQDFINTKLLGHRFDLVGQVDIVDTAGKFTEIDLEGFFLEFSLDVIRRSLQDYLNNFAAKHLNEYFSSLDKIIAALSRARQLIHYQHYQIEAGKHRPAIRELLDHDLVIIPVGYQGHAITLIKYGDYLAKCDRRRVNAFTDHLAVSRIGRPHRFNEELVMRCLYEKSSAKFIESELPSLLDLRPVSRLMLKRQISGNCSWANVEATVPLALLYLTQVGDQPLPTIVSRQHPAIRFYRQWQEWDKDRALSFCMQDFRRASDARKASKAALLAAILFQRCGAKYQKDIRRAKKIVKLLRDSKFEYAIEHYLEVYTRHKRTEAGKNLVKLLELVDDPFAGEE